MKDHGIKIPDKNEKKFKETHKLKISTDQKMSQGLEEGEVEVLKFKRTLIDKDIPRMY